MFFQVEWVEQQVIKKRVKRDTYNDPKWPKMWYLVSNGLFYPLCFSVSLNSSYNRVEPGVWSDDERGTGVGGGLHGQKRGGVDLGRRNRARPSRPHQELRELSSLFAVAVM